MYCQRFALGLLCVTTLWACDGGSTSDSSVDEADTHGEDAATVDSDAAAETPDAETPDAGPLDVGTADAVCTVGKNNCPTPAFNYVPGDYVGGQ